MSTITVRFINTDIFEITITWSGPGYSYSFTIEDPHMTSYVEWAAVSLQDRAEIKFYNTKRKCISKLVMRGDAGVTVETQQSARNDVLTPQFTAPLGNFPKRLMEVIDLLRTGGYIKQTYRDVCAYGA